MSEVFLILGIIFFGYGVGMVGSILLDKNSNKKIDELLDRIQSLENTTYTHTVTETTYYKPRNERLIRYAVKLRYENRRNSIGWKVGWKKRVYENMKKVFNEYGETNG